MISKVPHKFVKLDGEEVWALDPEGYETSLIPAVRWFSSNDADDLDALKSVSRMQSNVKRKKVKFPWHSKHELHGVKWVRDVPWDDVDDEPPPRNVPKSGRIQAVLKPVDPEMFEKYPQLRAFWDNDWLNRCGEPLPLNVTAGPAVDLIGAFFTSMHTTWLMTRSNVVMNIWIPWIRQNLTKEAETHYLEWRKELIAETETIYYQKIKPKLPRESRRYRLEYLGSNVGMDMVHIIMEQELSKNGMPQGLFSQIWSVYKAGHYPYDWEGEFPEGRLLAY